MSLIREWFSKILFVYLILKEYSICIFKQRESKIIRYILAIWGPLRPIFMLQAGYRHVDTAPEYGIEEEALSLFLSISLTLSINYIW